MGIFISIIIIGLIIFFTLRHIYWYYWYDHSDTDEYCFLDLFGEWSNPNIDKTIRLLSSKAIYSKGRSCFINQSTGSFIDPLSGSWRVDTIDNNVLTLKGNYISNRTRIDEMLMYVMMNGPSNKKIDDRDYILNDKIIELKFKYIIKDINTLELIPLNENSKLFTFNQGTTVWKKRDDTIPRDFGQTDVGI